MKQIRSILFCVVCVHCFLGYALFASASPVKDGWVDYQSGFQNMKQAGKSVPLTEAKIKQMSTPDLEQRYTVAKKEFKRLSDAVILALKTQITPKILARLGSVFDGISGITTYENGFYNLNGLTPANAALVADRTRSLSISDFDIKRICPDIINEIKQVEAVYRNLVCMNHVLLSRFSGHPKKGILYQDQTVHNKVFWELFSLNCNNMLNRGMDMYKILSANEAVYRSRIQAVDTAGSPEALSQALETLSATFDDADGIRFSRQRYAEFIAGEVNRKRQMLPPRMVDPPKGVELIYAEKNNGLDRAYAWLGIGFLTATEQQLKDENLVRDSIESMREEGATYIIVGAIFGNKMCRKYLNQLSSGKFDNRLPAAFIGALKRARFFSAKDLNAVYDAYLESELVSRK